MSSAAKFHFGIAGYLGVQMAEAAADEGRCLKKEVPQSNLVEVARLGNGIPRPALPARHARKARFHCGVSERASVAYARASVRR